MRRSRGAGPPGAKQHERPRRPCYGARMPTRWTEQHMFCDCSQDTSCMTRARTFTMVLAC
eukprot:6887815-Prymnesium_polylepis.1